MHAGRNHGILYFGRGEVTGGDEGVRGEKRRGWERGEKACGKGKDERRMLSEGRRNVNIRREDEGRGRRGRERKRMGQEE